MKLAGRIAIGTGAVDSHVLQNIRRAFDQQRRA